MRILYVLTYIATIIFFFNVLGYIAITFKHLEGRLVKQGVIKYSITFYLSI